VSATGEQLAPLLRVVAGGEPTDDELAAVVTAVLVLRCSGVGEDAARSRWADRRRLLRSPIHPGPGAWRASGSPR